MDINKLPSGFAASGVIYTVVAGFYGSNGERNITYSSEELSSFKEAHLVYEFAEGCTFDFREIHKADVITRPLRSKVAQ